MHTPQTNPSFDYFSRVFLPICISIAVLVGLYFLYTKTLQRKRLFIVLCILFLTLSLIKGYLEKHVIVLEPTVPLRNAYHYLFFDKKWPKEFETKRQIYLQSRAAHPNLYYLYDSILNPFYYSLIVSLIPLGIYTFFGDLVPKPEMMLRFTKTFWNRKNSSTRS
jgi:hypothetical protein